MYTVPEKTMTVQPLLATYAPSAEFTETALLALTLPPETKEYSIGTPVGIALRKSEDVPDQPARGAKPDPLVGLLLPDLAIRAMVGHWMYWPTAAPATTMMLKVTEPVLLALSVPTNVTG
jgi:hypothetical protein